MKVLFIASGNHGVVTPVVKNQADALISEGVEIEWYLLKGKGTKGYLQNIVPLRKHLRENRYDAIHAHYSLSAFVASLAGAQPLLVSLMGSDVKAAGWQKFVIHLFATCYHWNAIIVKSTDMYRALGINRALVIPNGVNLDRFHLIDKEECKTRLGWDAKKKHILFPAKASRSEKDYNLAEAAVRELEHKIDMASEIVLHAFDNTPNDETPYWYNASDAVLMTSKWEGSPNAIKEAMACGCPIVSVDVGDVAERTDGVEGCYIVRNREPRELAEAIEKALAFTDKTKGREKIIEDGLSNHLIAKRIIAIYEHIIGK